MPYGAANEISLPRETNMCVPGGCGRMVTGGADGGAFGNHGRHATRFAGASRR